MNIILIRTVSDNTDKDINSIHVLESHFTYTVRVTDDWKVNVEIFADEAAQKNDEIIWDYFLDPLMMTDYSPGSVQDMVENQAEISLYDFAHRTIRNSILKCLNSENKMLSTRSIEHDLVIALTNEIDKAMANYQMPNE